MQYSFRDYYLYREMLRIYNQDEPEGGGLTNDSPSLGIYQPFEQDPVDQPKLTKTGRLRLKRQSASPAKDMSWLQDVGFDANDAQTDATFPERLKQIRMMERFKGVPFVSWIVAQLRNNSSYEGQPASRIWQAIRRGEVGSSELERALTLTANTSLGKMSLREFMSLVPHVNWVPPNDEKHLKSLPTDNGMIDDRTARIMTRKRGKFSS